MSDPTKAPPSARRAALGFSGSGQVLSLRVSEDQLASLRQALQDGRGGWYEVEATDGAVLVDLAQAAELSLLEPHGERLAPGEADVHAARLDGGVGHQCAGSTSSVRTPPVAFGRRNATREPRMPRRGSSSITRNPASFTAARDESMSSHA